MLKATIEDGQLVFRVPLYHVRELRQERPTVTRFSYTGAVALGPVENTVILNDGGEDVSVRVDAETMKTLWDLRGGKGGR